MRELDDGNKKEFLRKSLIFCVKLVIMSAQHPQLMEYCFGV